MTKSEYLAALSEALGDLEEKTKSEILLEMNDHLDELQGRHPGTAEAELVASLDPPDLLAAALMEEAAPAQPRPKGEGKGKIRFHVDGVEKDFGDLGDLRELGARLKRALGGMEMRFESGTGERRRSRSGDDSRTFEASLGSPLARELEIKVSTADIRVTRSGGLLSLRAVGRSAESSLDIKDSGIAVRVQESEGLGGHLLGSGLDLLELGVPPYIERLVVKTASGDVSIRGCDAEIHAATASGDILVEDCPDSITISTASGDIHAIGLSGEIAAQTASGDIEVQAADIDSGGRMATVSGDISLTIPPDADVSIRADSASGDIAVDGLERRSGSIVLGAGSGRLAVSSVSGDIAIRRSQM